MVKPKMVKVIVFPQKGIYEPYFNVYKGKKFLGTLEERQLEGLVGHDTETFFDAYGTEINVAEKTLKAVLNKPPRKKSKPRKKKFKAPFHIETWEERDRANLGVYDANNQLVIEWWDEALEEAITDGFLDPDDFERSAIEYAMASGLIGKSNPRKPLYYFQKKGWTIINTAGLHAEIESPKGGTIWIETSHGSFWLRSSDTLLESTKELNQIMGSFIQYVEEQSNPHLEYGEY